MLNPSENSTAVAFFLRGLGIGFSIAAPVGPIGILCIQRTLLKGRNSGLVSGLGAASADAVYGAVAGFGLIAVSSFLVNQQMMLRLVGGLFLCYLGVKLFLQKPAAEAAAAQSSGLTADYTSTFLLTLTNPATILSFAAIFAGMGLGAQAGTRLSAVTMVAGVFLGSAAWWLILSTGTSYFRKRIDSAKLRWINRMSGIVLCTFGLLALLTWTNEFYHPK
jgi:threonine/homoserine/homoserine lactone efflux protein